MLEFSTGSLHAKEEGAVWAEEVALHYSLTKLRSAPSYSGAIARLKAKLLNANEKNMTDCNC